MTTTPAIPNELAYLMLRTSLERFKKPTIELGDDEFAFTLDQARKQYAIETRVLTSPEAGRVNVPEDQVKQSLDNILAKYETSEAYEADLERNGMDREGFEQSVRRELRIEAAMELAGSRAATINDIEVKIYYYMHLEKFQRPETRTARHILITINPEYPENTREQAQKRAQKILDKLKGKPKRFEELAQKHSECPTAMHGGLLGKVPRAHLYPELDKTLFKMRENGISDLIESEIGFHILWCESVHSAGVISLKEVYPRILELLQKRRQRICQKYWLQQLAPSAKESAQ